SHFPIPIALTLILLTSGCETTQSRRPAPTVPQAAMAPTMAPQAPAAKIVEPARPAADPVEVVLTQARREYEAGRSEYAAGHLEAAKRHFDRAFDVLVQSPGGIRSDERLEREFELVVAGIAELEARALREGDGFTEQQSEPAPIDEANEATFDVDPNLRARAEADVQMTASDLPLMINDVVAGYVNYFANSTRGRATIQRGWARGGRFHEMIQQTLKDEGVPQELIFLAQAESGFHPLAVSRAGARGMWQFMASRATEYGLQRNWWLDERQDPEKATRAAARHLRDLYQQFGDWYLAMAAYNSGPGNVQAAVRRTGYADFWELYKRNVLPNETKNYVPIILAVTIISKNPEKYGLQPIELEPQLDVDRVSIDYPVDLRLAAEAVDVSVSMLQELNPSLLRMTTPKESQFEMRLPAGTAEAFQKAMAAIPKDMRVWWRYHRVAPGDTISTLARRYRTTSEAILEVNDLENDQLLAETKLIIPVAPGKRPMGEEGLVYSKKATRYRVRKGDTVLSIADDFGVPPEKVRQWNRIKGSSVSQGRMLRIYRPVGVREASQEAVAKSSRKKGTQTAANGKRRVHTVKPGETLYSIANAYNTTVAELKRDNRLASNKLFPGDTLVINGGR
ncbi:MAG: LysM peptidoglycan-binding domain-containing protein, partial [Terriglobales bacterium]